MANPDYPKEYYQKNREAILAKQKERYEAKKEEIRAYAREYQRRKRSAAKNKYE